MKTTYPPIPLSPVRDLERTAFVYIKPGQKDGEIYIEKENGDTEIVTPLTKADAIALIAGLKEAFGLRDTEDVLRRLLQSREDNVEEFVESFAVTCIANVMYENGLKTAVLTPARILSGEVPNVEIDNTAMGCIKYTLLGEPLNVPDTTNDTSADNQ